MSNKEQRKELELLIVKSIEEVLSQKNSEASIKIKKTSALVSKIIAKKFIKAIKSITSTKSKVTKPAIAPKKTVASKANVTKTKVAQPKLKK